MVEMLLGRHNESILKLIDVTRHQVSVTMLETFLAILNKVDLKMHTFFPQSRNKHDCISQGDEVTDLWNLFGL